MCYEDAGRPMATVSNELEHAKWYIEKVIAPTAVKRIVARKMRERRKAKRRKKKRARWVAAVAQPTTQFSKYEQEGLRFKDILLWLPYATALCLCACMAMRYRRQLRAMGGYLLCPSELHY